MKIGIGLNEIAWEYSYLSKNKIRLCGPHDKVYFTDHIAKIGYYDNGLIINIEHVKRI